MNRGKTKVAAEKHPQVNEPIRKSMFDIIHDNFKLANRQIYIHRLFYIGYHAFEDVIGENVCDYFYQIITEINSKNCDEKLTGFLLYYPKYFSHIVEGSEDSLQKHLRRVMKEPKFGTCKVLTVYHHMNQRFISNWTYITAKPATLLEKIDPNSNLENTNSKIMYCIQKLYKLGRLLRRQEDARKAAEESTSSGGFSANFLPSDNNPMKSLLPPIRQTVPEIKVVENVEQVTPACLPEYSVLDFLIETSYTQRLDDYCKSFGAIPNLEEYEDLVWPIASDGIPKNVFDKEFNPVNDLPNIKAAPDAEAAATSAEVTQ